MYNPKWSDTWSIQNQPAEEGLTVEYFEDSDGWFQHLWNYSFNADNDEEAKVLAERYIEATDVPMEVFSLYNETDEVILTEENL